MDNKFKKNMEDIFDIASDEVEIEVIESKKIPKGFDDADKDYEYVRGQMYSLVETGKSAIEELLDVARSSNHPRAYEVAFQGIKNVSEIADKLSDLHKKMKDLKSEDKKFTPSTINNTMFVGSTADLAKMLKDASKNINNE